jgi:hypothetical protein
MKIRVTRADGKMIHKIKLDRDPSKIRAWIEDSAYIVGMAASIALMLLPLTLMRVL